MSIEQTNQLILLILNSVLMTLLSSFLLGGVWLRQNSLLNQLNQTRSHYHRLTHQKASPKDTHKAPKKKPLAPKSAGELANELKQLREHRQRLSSQYQWSRMGLLTLHLAVLVLSVSLFALTLRSLLAFDSLISTALFLFTLGAAGLLTGTSCILIDFAQGNSNGDSLGRSFAQVIQQLSRIPQQWSHSTRSLSPSIKAKAVQPLSIKAESK